MNSLRNVVLVFILLSAIAKANTKQSLYNEFVTEILDIEGRNQKILEALPNITDTDWIYLKMLDASSKIPSGILEGNFMDLGNFDECYNIAHEGIFGKYCLGVLTINPQTQKFFDGFNFNTTKLKNLNAVINPRSLSATDPDIGFHLATCMPHNLNARSLPGGLIYKDKYCYSKATEPELSTGANVMIGVLSVILALVLASTTIDIFFHYTQQKPPHELLLSFSFLTNGRKLFRISTNSEQFSCLNGIRAISMIWVIIGHEYSNAMFSSFNNLIELINFTTKAENMFIVGATVSVDTFFVAGGLVTVYAFLKSQEKSANFNVFFYYLHRYLRLTPVFVIISLFHLYLINYMGNAPLWKLVDESLVKTCEKSWWSSFLYITNYVQDGNCLPQTWYLSVDMQLFILSPLVLIPLKRWPKIGLAMLTILSVLGCVVPFAIAYAEDLGTMTGSNVLTYMTDYYMQTHTRFGAYVIGMVLGYFLYKLKKGDLKIRLPNLLVPIVWLGLLTVLTACVYAGYSVHDDDRWGSSLFTAFNRPAWSLAVSGVILMCVTGYGGPIDAFLSLPVFQLLTRLSYSIYLVHYSVITARYALMKTSYHFSHLVTMHAFWGDFMFTFFISIVVCLAFESPVIVLEKHLFKLLASSGGKKKEKKNVGV